MLIKIVAAVLLAAFLWTLLRFALGLRWAKLSREAGRRAEEAQGRRVVAELPLDDGSVELLLEDGGLFLWGATTVAKSAIGGGRLHLNGGLVAECRRPGVALPAPGPPEEFDGRERWEVVLHMADGARVTIPCGSLREGVSRETARRAYEAVRAAITARG
jgi:hypothetical protein